MGVEFASVFNRFGSEVTVLEMLPRIVPVEDEEVSKELERAFRKAKIRVETGAAASNVRKTGDGVTLTVKLSNGKSEEMTADKLLVAVGRKPNTERIGLENTKIVPDRGFIVVNEWQQTAEPGVYAIGDIVAGTPQLAHVATMQGMVAVGTNCREAGQAGKSQPHSGRHVHRARHRQRGTHGGPGPRAGSAGEDREISVHGQQQGHHRGKT